MDLPVYLRVLKRFRVLVAAGLLLACVLAFLSLARVSPTGVTWRKAPTYVAFSRLFVTQPGFPWGSLRPPVSADANRFTSLAILYSQLALSDPVHQILLRSGPVNGTVDVAPVLDPASNNAALPLISVAGFANTPKQAIALSQRETDALLTYIHQQQSTSAISAKDRVLVQLVTRATDAKVFQARKLTLAVVVFLGVLLATFALAFLLENLRPRMRAEEAAALHPVARDAA
jgi:hypothetical protein